MTTTDTEVPPQVAVSGTVLAETAQTSTEAQDHNNNDNASDVIPEDGVNI